VNLKKRLLSIAAAGALGAGLLVSLNVGAASAAPSLGTLTLTPATGTSSTGLSASLSAACPGDSTGLVGYMGGGLPANTPNPGDVNSVVDPTSVIQGNRPAAQTFSLSGTFADVFAANSVSTPRGSYTVRIACIGPDFFTETGEFTQTVNFTGQNYATVVPAAPTTTVLSQNNASGAFGSSVTFTADATDGVAGSVQFKDNGTNLGSAQAVNATGVATLTTSSLAVGSHPITAVFTPTNATTHDPSTSNGVTYVVTSVGTSLGLVSNGPTAQYAPATFTATVSPVVAGTVTFNEGPTVLGTSPVNGSGVATFTSTSLSVGAHSVVAHFTPAVGSGADPADSAPVSHSVTAFSGVSLSENIIVEVPAGGLVMVLDDLQDGQVDLGVAQINAGGDLLTASGAMDPVKVTDTRAGDPGWTASGIVSDFTLGANAFNGYNLGWAPTVLSSSVNQVGIAAGPAVTAGTEGSATSVPSDPAIGLESSRILAVAQDNAGNGTARLGAALSLNIPTDVPAGVYNATLTLTAA